MKRVFVYESISAGDFDEDPAARGLLAEGRAMLGSIAIDLARVQGLGEVVVALGARAVAADLEAAGVRVERAAADDRAALFDRLAGEADATLVIAPEIDGRLESLTRRVLAAGGRLLGAAPAATALCGDKLRCAVHLRAHGVPVAELRAIEDGAPLPVVEFPAVVKPRHGAGAVATYRAGSAGELERALAAIAAAERPRPLVVGPLVPGLAASASFLIGRGGRVALSPGLQEIAFDGAGPARVSYLGGRVPLSPPALAARARDLAERAVAAIPGLSGFAGVDLVLDLAGGAAGDRVIEINPRPTTSIVGLVEHHAPWSIGRAWLDLWRGEAVTPPPLGPAVRFAP